MDTALRQKLADLPAEPGCYLMKDRQGEVVYVGKASSLRSRVRSYFDAGRGDERAFVALLDELLGDIDVIVTSSEKEAILLENELIKQHQPRFNVLLKDDKNFICLSGSTSATPIPGWRCGGRASARTTARATSARTRARAPSARPSAS